MPPVTALHEREDEYHCRRRIEISRVRARARSWCAYLMVSYRRFTRHEQYWAAGPEIRAFIDKCLLGMSPHRKIRKGYIEHTKCLLTSALELMRTSAVTVIYYFHSPDFQPHRQTQRTTPRYHHADHMFSRCRPRHASLCPSSFP